MSFFRLIEFVKSDFTSHGGRGIFQCLRLYLFSPKFRLILNYRLGHYFYSNRNYFFKLFAQIYMYRQITKRNCQISYKAKIGKGVMFMHPLGIVIGEGVIIGDNVKIWQQVTLGSHGKSSQKMEYPIVGDRVRIFAGAKVFGGITIGNGATVGANSMVNKDVLANQTAVGIPARIINNL